MEAQRAHHFRFCSEIIKFRLSHPLLGRETFLSPSECTWHETNWDNDESRFLAYTLHGARRRPQAVQVWP